MNEMSVEEHLKDFYRHQELRREKLDELRALGDEKSPRRERENADETASWTWRQFVVHRRLVATIALLLIGAFVLGRISHPAASGDLNDAALARAIGREIAMNHKKQLNLEFAAADYASLQPQMSKLDFALAPPEDPAAARLQVIGARYCSIQGQLAAQIRARDRAGQVYTLYQTKLNDKLRSATSGELKAEGVRIRLWRENGLFYGLAVNWPQSE